MSQRNFSPIARLFGLRQGLVIFLLLILTACNEGACVSADSTSTASFKRISVYGDPIGVNGSASNTNIETLNCPVDTRYDGQNRYQYWYSLFEHHEPSNNYDVYLNGAIAFCYDTGLFTNFPSSALDSRMSLWLDATDASSSTTNSDNSLISSWLSKVGSNHFQVEPLPNVICSASNAVSAYTDRTASVSPVNYPPGDYDRDDLRDDGTNDDINIIDVPIGCQASIYEGTNFNDQNLT